MTEWFPEAGRILQDEMICIKYGPSKELLVHLRNLKNTDYFKGIQEEKFV